MAKSKAARSRHGQTGGRVKTAGPYRARLVIMLKAPVMGRVKTRLGKAIGPVAATFFFRHAAHALIGRLACDPRWQTILSVSPDHDLYSRALPYGIARMAQGTGDLGARMQRPFDRLPPGPVIVIGSDIPQILPRHIARSFALLGPNDVVVGPAEDGGYWLIGQKRRPRVLRPFQSVGWSRADTMSRTLDNLRQDKIGFASILNDVDGPEDFAMVRGWCGRLVLPLAQKPAPSSH